MLTPVPKIPREADPAQLFNKTRIKNNVKVFVGICYSLFILCILILGFWMKIDKYLLTFSAFFIFSLIYQLIILKADNPKSCLLCFKINNLTGLFVFLFIFSFQFSLEQSYLLFFLEEHS